MWSRTRLLELLAVSCRHWHQVKYRRMHWGMPLPLRLSWPLRIWVVLCHQGWSWWVQYWSHAACHRWSRSSPPMTLYCPPTASIQGTTILTLQSLSKSTPHRHPCSLAVISYTLISLFRLWEWQVSFIPMQYLLHLAVFSIAVIVVPVVVLCSSTSSLCCWLSSSANTLSLCFSSAFYLCSHFAAFAIRF